MISSLAHQYSSAEGWHYRLLHGIFYPTNLPLTRWFDFYAERFISVEINNTFYRLPEAETFASWRT